MSKKKLSNKAAEALRGINTKKKKEPLWKGPESTNPNGGITQSMLGAFLVCRERFRIRYVEGLSVAPAFRHQLEYGNMWHLCEEHQVEERRALALVAYALKLKTQYPLQVEQIRHWYNVCKLQFSIYLKHYAKDKDQKQWQFLMPEEVFLVSYKLPSGRKVVLRGKWDGVGLLGTKKKPELFLLEHKTKGDVDEQATDNQLTFDLQTMFYVTALWERIEGAKSIIHVGKDYGPLKGFWYNVVRRPLSGGVGSIRPHKETKTKPAETMEHFYDRLGDIIRDNPENFFYRWKVRISKDDVEKFKREFLNPVLEQLCLWYDMASGKTSYTLNNLHWRHPYGVFNPMDQGRKSDIDEYLLTGSKLGLVQTTLFQELK